MNGVETEWAKEQWVHVRRIEKHDVFAIVQKDGTIDEESMDDAHMIAFTRDRKRKFAVGATYLVEVRRDTEPQAFRVTSARFVGTWQDTQAVQRWQITQRLRDIEEQAAKDEAKLADVLADTLKPLREIYRKQIGYTRRTTFELLVLQYLRGVK